MIKGLVLYLLGFFSCAFLFYFFIFSGLEAPFTGFVVRDFNSYPSNWISAEDVIVLDDSVVIKIDNATLSSYEGTGSMLPVFGENSNGIRIIPESEDDIDVGDIISFRSDGVLIVHRVVEKGADERGVYFITRGDNSLTEEIVRFEDVEYVTVGVLW